MDDQDRPRSGDHADHADSASDEPTGTERLPLFPLSAPLFPGAALPLHIFEERYRDLIRERGDIDPVFGVVLIRSGLEVGAEAEIHPVGTAASMIGRRRYPDGRADIAVRGERRFRIVRLLHDRPWLEAEVSWLAEDAGAIEPEQIRTLRGGMVRLIRAAAEAGGLAVPEMDLPDDARELSYLLAQTLWINTWERQELLEIPTTAERLDRLGDIVRREYQLLRRTGATGVPIERPGSRFGPN